MTKLLIICHEPVGTQMTGPAIRCWELARVLGRFAAVTLAVPGEPDLPADGARIHPYRLDDPESVLSAAREAEAILVSGYLLQAYPGLAELGRPLIVDIYDPFPVENFELYEKRPVEEQVDLSARDFQVLRGLLGAGDFFICGSERQRAFWMGMLAAVGRINPRTHRADPSLRLLIDVVPMGIPDAAPDAGGTRIKGVIPGIDPDDFLAVWPGGVWEWLDPVSLIEAMRLIADQAPDVRLLFPGIRHPRPEIVGPMAVQDLVLRRSEELGLLGRTVFCKEWTPYRERVGYLADADVAVSLHRDCLEAHLAIRARLLDCIWTGTPVVATRGDLLADEMAGRGLATLAGPGDPEGVARAILDWRSRRADRPALAPRFHEMAEDYRWSNVARPLIEYVRDPWAAPDRERPQVMCQARPGDSVTPSGGEDRPAESVTVDTPALAAARRRWQRDDVLDLPFDQYQRHRQAAEIVEALRQAPEEPLRILDVGSGPAVTRRFLTARDLVVSVDLRPQPGPLSVVGDATALPFPDEAFDFCMTLDALEHLPAHLRLRMIDECLRVAKRGLVLIAPTASREAFAAERVLFEFIRLVLRAEHPSLLEHLQNGLPDVGMIEAQLQQLGYPYLVRPSGYIHRWLAMMLVKHYVQSLPASESLHHQIDNYYNRGFFDADQRSPAYRSLFFIAKSGDRADLERVARALDVPDEAARAGDDGQALGQLGLLVDLFTLRSITSRDDAREALRQAEAARAELERRAIATDDALAVERARVGSLEASLDQARRELGDRELELTKLRDLLDRIGRGKVMRAMNLFHGAVGRRSRPTADRDPSGSSPNGRA